MSPWHTWSPHRQAVDAFQRLVWPELARDARCLDIGGRRPPARGTWDRPAATWYEMDVRHGRVSYVGTVERLPHRAATFDAIRCVEVLYLVHDVEGALEECARVLKPGGWFVATVPALHPRMEDADWLRMHREHWIHAMHRAFGEGSMGNVLALGGPSSGILQILHRDGSRPVRKLARVLAPLARRLDAGREERWPLAWGIVSQAAA